MECSKKNVTTGDKFVEELISGEFKKNYRPNKGLNFTGGFEGNYFDFFEKYLCSCGCYMMDNRLKREDYYGGL